MNTPNKRNLKLKGEPFFGIAKLLKLIGPFLINSKLFLFVEPLTRVLLPIAYTFRFAKWYSENSVRTHLLPTEKPFGYDNRYKLYNFIWEKQNLEGMAISYLEFGVAAGSSFKWWVEKNKNPTSRFYGFDTFSGLPENWGNVPKGKFSTEGKIPHIQDSRSFWQNGLFQDTLPLFLEKFSLTDKKTIVHLDADLYSSTIFVLVTIAPMLKAGDIIIFDEFADVVHEFRAFSDFMSAYNRIKLKILKAVNYGNKIAFIVDSQT